MPHPGDHSSQRRHHVVRLSDYVIEAGGFERSLSPWIALAAVVVMTLINLTGVQSGRRAQNLLTGSKLAGFAMVVLAGALVAIQHGGPRCPLRFQKVNRPSLGSR